jgi:hypothetical protein
MRDGGAQAFPRRRRSERVQLRAQHRPFELGSLDSMECELHDLASWKDGGRPKGSTSGSHAMMTATDSNANPAPQRSLAVRPDRAPAP